jgi:HPt (histidine-containing phosphotransfer) domain-containing protein
MSSNCDPDLPGGPAGEAELPVLDRGTLDEIRRVRVPGKADLLGRMAQAYLAAAPRHLATVQAALEQQDCKGLADGAHAMKSSSGALGIVRVARLCGTLEQSARGGTLDGTPELVSRLRAECARAAEALAEMVPAA